MRKRTLKVYVTNDEYEQIYALARVQNFSMSDYVRLLINNDIRSLSPSILPAKELVSKISEEELKLLQEKLTRDPTSNSGISNLDILNILDEEEPTV